MSATGPGTFFTDRRTADDGKIIPVVGVTCRSCGKEDYTSIVGKTPSIGSKVFSARGWMLGKRGRHRDLCPDCGTKARTAADAKNRTPKQRRMAHRIAAGHIDLGAGETAAMELVRVPRNEIMAAVLEPVKKAMEAKQARDGTTPAATPAEAAPAPAQAAGDGGNYKGTGYAKKWNAARSAKAFVRSLGIADPQEGVHFAITEEPGGTYGYDLIEQPALPEEPQPEPVEAEEIELQAQPRETLRLAEEPRKPLPSDNRRILSALEEHYDADNRRYLANFSDESVAQKLNVPRAWIAAVREQFDFGPDRNVEGDALARKLRAALSEAEGVRDRLLAMAADADTLVANLTKKLGGLI